MTTQTAADALREDLLAVARFDDAEARDRAARLLDALVPARLTRLLAEMAEEVSRVLPAGRIEMRLAGSEVEAVYVEDPAPPPPPDDEDNAARITVRLGSSLKEAVEKASMDEGVSVNAFVVGALTAATHRHGRRRGRRLRGWGRA